MGVSMESDDSRASSASNSSESLSNSRPPTPIKQQAEGDESASAEAAAISSSNAVLNSPEGALSSSSSSSNSSSSSSRSAGSKHKKKSSSSSSSSSASSSSSSSDDEPEPEQDTLAEAAAAAAVVANEAGSPNKSQPSSFLSSVRSRSNSPQLYIQGAVDLNISHEDLSDVSDIGSEKNEPSKNNSLHANDDDDDDDDGVISNDSLPPLEEPRMRSNGNVHIEERKFPFDQAAEDKTVKESKTLTARSEETSNGLASRTTDAVLEDLVKPHDDDPLDFEAEEGECHDISKDTDNEAAGDDAKGSDAKKASDSLNEDDGELDGGDDNEDNAAALAKKKKDEEELEEGEVSDEDEKRPEETEPKPVCRFYTRGQCTWGMSCRFLHPGVTDKGNYTMFESLVRSVPMQGGSSTARPPASTYNNHASASTDYHDYRNERPVLHHRSAMHHAPSMYASAHDARSLAVPEVPVVMENAWERGLRTAKEMMRKANKRKEQDMDFEDKKMNLTLSPDELEKDPYYIKERGSSPTAYNVYSPPERYGRPQYMPPTYEDVDAYGRMARYRELPPHRMPQYEDDRRLRPAREVIVQRVETVGRGDEWIDPWMRSKSIGRDPSFDRDERRRQHIDRRSYSSNSSYSSSNSSQSDSSSDSSRSSSPSDHKRRYGSHKMLSASRRHAGARARSPSQIPRRPRRSPAGSVSPSYKRPILDKRGVHSPAAKRKKLSPGPKKFDKLRRRRSSSTSESDSSDTSYSDSDSGSSSSESSSGSRETPQKRMRATEKALNERKLIKKPAVEPITKKRSPISIEIKKPSTMVGVSALVSPTNSPHSDKEKDSKDKDKDKDNKDGKKSRREELLKQLRAVEDAIAKKRSKLA